MALDPFRYEIATPSPLVATPEPAGARVGLGGVAALETTNPLPGYQQPVLSAGGDTWFPNFGRFATIKHTPPAAPGSGGGATTPPPAATYNQAAVKAAIRQAFGPLAGADANGPIDRLINGIVAGLFPSGTTGVTLAKVQQALNSAQGLPRSLPAAQLVNAVSKTLDPSYQPPTTPSTGTPTTPNTTTPTNPQQTQISALSGNNATGGLRRVGTETATPATGAAPAASGGDSLPVGGGGPSSPGSQSTSTGSHMGSVGTGGPVGPNGQDLAPGLLGAAYGAATGQQMSPGYVGASMIGALTGPAGLATSVLGQALNHLGFQPSLDPHATQDPSATTPSGFGDIDGLGGGVGADGGPTGIGSTAGGQTDGTGIGETSSGIDSGGYGSSYGDIGGLGLGGGDEGAGNGDTGGGGDAGDAGGDAGGGGESNSGGGDTGTGAGTDGTGGMGAGGMYARGGMVRPMRGGLASVGANYAGGGMVDQSRLGPPNPPGPDDGYAFLDGGEYVVRADQVPKYRATLEAMNQGAFPPDQQAMENPTMMGRKGYAEGGMVGDKGDETGKYPGKPDRPEGRDKRTSGAIDVENEGYDRMASLRGRHRMEEEADWLRSRGYQRNDFKRELGSYAAGGMVDPMQPGAPPMLGQGQAMPGDADEGFTGMEDDGDYGMGDEGMAMMGGHPLMPPDMGGMLTPDMAMERLAQLPPDQMQVLAMSMADPTIAGAWGTLLGPGFEGLLNMLMQGQGAGMMGGGMGAAPQPQMGGGGMGGYAGGGLVHPSMPQARGGLPAGRPNAAPPGVRPGMSPMKREPVPFQPPRRGMAGVGM